MIQPFTTADAMQTIGTANPPAAIHRLIQWAGKQIDVGAMTLVTPNGAEVPITGTQPGPQARIQLHRWRALRRLMSGGSVGFAEAYIDGDWNSPDVVAVVEFAARNRRFGETALSASRWLNLWRRVGHALARNSRRGSRRNIARHYDLGNEFFASWLDPSMTYSSAVFAEPGQDLGAAQQNKYRRIMALLEPRPGDHILEIGCGWGGFATHAAGEHGANVTAITVSRAQHEQASRRIFEAGLADRVKVALTDYRAVTEKFDHVVSIEMLEAVGEAYWPVYFAKIRDCLRPGGRVGLQAILIDDQHFEHYRSNPDFIQTHIFPGGMLPAPGVLEADIRRAGLKTRETSSHGIDYARTLKLWRKAFEAAWPAISRQGFDDRFRRLWRFYLAYCEGGFRAGAIDVRQLGLVRD